MKYDQITDIKEVKKIIYHCFELLCKEDRQRFEKKLYKQPGNPDQKKHTLNELILGAYLSAMGFKVRYEYSVANETPDWCVLDNKLAVISIVELVNFHRDKDTENEIDKQMQAKGGAIFWSRENLPKYRDRLYYHIRNKMQKYQALIKELRAPYIVAICPDWRAGTNFEKLLPCLHDNESDGLFKMYQDVGGVLYFEGNLEQYSFRYEQNPNTLQKFDLPSGALSFVTKQGSQRGTSPLLHNHSPSPKQGERD